MSGGMGVQPPHQSVLYNEILNALKPVSPNCYLDGTLGAGGHAFGILGLCRPSGRLLGLDVDPQALEIARARLAPFGERAILKKGSYHQAAAFLAELGWEGLDGIVLDLGVSSMQIDQPERGFSFQKAGRLDMRFDQSTGKSAADLVNTSDEKALADIIYRYGEERYARRIAAAIVKARPIYQTEELAEVIRKAIGWSEQKIDPATRTFQALRIAVNEELTRLEGALPDLIALLNPGGILAVIAFHSLEDKIVKSIFRRESRDCICPPEQPLCTCQHRAAVKVLTNKPIRPGEAEVEANPRARSARLRLAQKLQLA